MTKGLCVPCDEGKNYCVTREKRLKDIHVHDCEFKKKKTLRNIWDVWILLKFVSEMGTQPFLCNPSYSVQWQTNV